jgi:hypothetical protein
MEPEGGGFAIPLRASEKSPLNPDRRKDHFFLGRYCRAEMRDPT